MSGCSARIDLRIVAAKCEQTGFVRRKRAFISRRNQVQASLIAKKSWSVVLKEDAMSQLFYLPAEQSQKEQNLYKQRHEIMFDRIKDWRRIAMCYDRCAHTFFHSSILN